MNEKEDGWNCIPIQDNSNICRNQILILYSASDDYYKVVL